MKQVEESLYGNAWPWTLPAGWHTMLQSRL